MKSKIHEHKKSNLKIASKKILFSLFATLLFFNFSSAQLMSDDQHKAMMDTYKANLSTLLTNNCPPGMSVDQFKRGIIKGYNSLSPDAQNSLFVIATDLTNYGYQFAAQNQLTVGNLSYAQFYGAFNPSTIVKNGKLAFSATSGAQMWSCALSSFGVNDCGSSALISNQNDLNTIANNTVWQLTQNGPLNYGVLIMIGGFSDCIYNQLGYKLINPYTTANMQQAFYNVNSRIPSGAPLLDSISSFSVKTSHLYVKIEPKDELEESALLNDTLQDFYDYPLDFAFPQDSTEQNVSVVDENGIGTYFAAVPVGYVFPAGIKTTTLDELYIPEDDNDSFFKDIGEPGQYNPISPVNKNDLFNSLLLEAFTLTGNQAEWDWQIITETGDTEKTDIIGGIPWRLSAHKWFPQGVVKMLDTTLGDKDQNQVAVPIEGAKVYVRHWFRTRTGITAADGSFHTQGIRGRSKYFIRWRRDEFSIRYNLAGVARTKFAYYRHQDWNPTFSEDPDIYAGTTFQAAFDYYYKDIEGLHRPQQNEIYRKQVKIACIDWWDSSLTLAQTSDIRAVFFAPLYFAPIVALAGGFAPTIYLQTYRAPSEVIYGTTIHELTHSAHYEMAAGNYNALMLNGYVGGDEKAKRVMESWAVCVETYLTNKRYKEYLKQTNYIYRSNTTLPDIDYFFDDHNYQNRTLPQYATDENSRSIRNTYTTAFFDLIDSENQGIDINLNTTLNPQDSVNGFSISQIQEIVKQCASWDDVIRLFNQYYPNTPGLNDSGTPENKKLFNNWH